MKNLTELEIRALLEKHGCSRSNLEYVLEMEKQNAKSDGGSSKENSKKARTKTGK